MATAAAYPHAFYPLHGHHLQDHEVGPSLTLINLWLRTRGFNENDFRSGAVVALDMTTTTPMHRAAYEDDLDIADFLFKQNGPLTDIANQNNTMRISPLHLAASRGRLRVLKKLLEKQLRAGDDGKAALWLKTGLQRTLLHESCLGGHFAVTRYLCQVMRSVSEATFKAVLMSRDSTGFTPVMAAASDGCADICMLLIMYGTFDARGGVALPPLPLVRHHPSMLLGGPGYHHHHYHQQQQQQLGGYGGYPPPAQYQQTPYGPGGPVGLGGPGIPPYYGAGMDQGPLLTASASFAAYPAASSASSATAASSAFSASSSSASSSASSSSSSSALSSTGSSGSGITMMTVAALSKHISTELLLHSVPALYSKLMNGCRLLMATHNAFVRGFLAGARVGASPLLPLLSVDYGDDDGGSQGSRAGYKGAKLKQKIADYVGVCWGRKLRLLRESYGAIASSQSALKHKANNPPLGGTDHAKRSKKQKKTAMAAAAAAAAVAAAAAAAGGLSTS